MANVLHRTLDELVAYPPHEPRKASAIYRKTHHHLIYDLDASCWVCGIRHSTGGAMETHHYHFEWASQNGLDLDKVTADWPAITDRQKLAEWIDSEGNMLVLCLPGSAPVLRPDGSETPIALLRAGDEVACPDGIGRPITAAMRREYCGELVRIDGRLLTPDHPVLTVRGWLPAGSIRKGDEVGEYVRVLDQKMVDLRRIQPEILGAIVRSDVIDVVNPFSGFKGPAQFLFHHPAVLEHGSSGVSLPDGSAYVSLRSDSAPEELAVTRTAMAGHILQSGQSAVGAAVASPSVPRREGGATSVARSLAEPSMSLAAPHGRACARTGRISVRDNRRDEECRAADEALLPDALPGPCRQARWRSVDSVERRMFDGFTHDITVASYPAFSTSGLIVHNCAAHHRGQHTGIHEISYPAWLLQRYESTDGFVFIDQSDVPVAHTPLLAPR